MNTNNRLIQQALETTLRTGETLRLSSITNETEGIACALYPYQPYIDKANPESARINAHLTSSGYKPSEAYWAIAIANNEGVQIFRFKRSQRLDILASHEVQPEERSKLAPGFEPSDCSSMETAAVAKIEVNGRSYLIMGQLK